VNTRSIWTVLALVMLSPVAAIAGTSVRADVGVSNGPATIQFSFHTAPDLIYVPEQRVYVVEDRRCDDDMFRCGDSWWAMREGRWYRARTWRGPFVFVQEREVPRSIWLVPERRWKRHPHGMPPGLAKKSDVVVVSQHRDVVVVKEKHRKHERDREDHGDHGDHGDR
jgi:hypothetical protein